MHRRSRAVGSDRGATPGTLDFRGPWFEPAGGQAGLRSTEKGPKFLKFREQTNKQTRQRLTKQQKRQRLLLQLCQLPVGVVGTGRSSLFGRCRRKQAGAFTELDHACVLCRAARAYLRDRAGDGAEADLRAGVRTRPPDRAPPRASSGGRVTGSCGTHKLRLAWTSTSVSSATAAAIPGHGATTRQVRQNLLPSVPDWNAGHSTLACAQGAVYVENALPATTSVRFHCGS